MCTICAHGAQNEIYIVSVHMMSIMKYDLLFPQFRGKVEVIGWIFLPGLSILKDCFWLDFGASEVGKAFLGCVFFMQPNSLLCKNGKGE